MIEYRKEVCHLKRTENQSNRADKVKRFIAKNWLFLMIAAIMCLYLLGTAVQKHNAKPSQEQTEVTQEVQEETHWRFYPIDLWVLVIGGGFCTVMILKEKKKARETLR